MGVKLGCSHWGRNVGWGCLRKGCWGECLGQKRDEASGEWRKLHKEEPNDLYCSPNTVRVIKSRIMWSRHVTVAFTNLLTFNDDFSFGKSQKSLGATVGGADGPGCCDALPKKKKPSWGRQNAQAHCRDEVDLLVTVNVTVIHYTSSVNGVSLPTD